MELVEVVAFLRAIGVWLGLIKKPPEPSPPDPTAEHCPDRRAVPMLVVDEKKPPLPPAGKCPGVG